MINGQIRDREVRLIGADGEQLGVISSREAQALADEAGMDLVKISPKVVPPVCKIMAYNIKNGAQMTIPDGCTAAGSDYGFAVQKSKNADLLKMFNKGLADIKANGTFDKIVDSYTK